MSNMFNPFIGVTNVISAEVSGKFAELQTKIDNIQSKGYDDTQLRNSIQQLSSAISGGIVVDAYTKLETNNLLSTKVNISDFNEYKEQISSELSSIVDNTIYDDTQIKADISELSSRLENLVDNDTIYDDTEIRNLISDETDARILEDTNLSSQIEILKLEKGDDYTAFEVFPHNFSFANPSNFNNGVVKTVGEMFGEWQKVTSATYKEQNVGSMNIMYRYGYNLYRRFHPFDGYIDLTIEEVTSLPETGQKNILYKIDTNYYLYYDEAIRNLRNCLTTAKDDDIFFGMDSSDKLIIKLRTKLTLQEVDADKSDVVIDWGDDTQTKFKDYTASGSWYDFEHEYSEEYMNKNCVVKIFGKDYYFINFKSTTTSSNGNGIVIITRMFDYDLPVASHLNIFSNINTNNLIFRIDASKCKRSFDGCNIASMFTTHNIQQIRGFSDNSKQFAFNSIYCMNYMFNGVKHIKTIDFKFPALCKLPIFQYIFNGIYFNYGGTPYDILNLFNNFSFNLIPKDEAIDVAGMFNNCKNITCSNIEKLGKILWNNPNLTWKNTSSVFGKVTADFLSGVPVEWGGTLTGWAAPTQLTQEYVDNKDNLLINDIVELSSKLENLEITGEIYDDTQLRSLISAETDARILEDTSLSSQIEMLNLEKGDDYTAFEVFPHNFVFANPSNPANGVIKTVGEAFAAWQQVNTANINTTWVSRNVGSFNILYKQNQAYKRFHPTSGYIDVTVQEVESLPEMGQIGLSYKIGTSYYLYYDESIRNLRNCLTTAKDDDIFFGMDSSNTLIIRLRTKLTLQEVNSDKSDVVIDWGDGTQTKFKDYTASGSWYDFEHEYTGDYVNKNSIVKIFGKDYYFINFTATTTGNANKIIIITRMFDYDLPIASHLNIFSNICASNLIYRIDASKCKRSFDGCNIASMFTTHNIQQIRGFSDNSKEFAFNSIYCMNYMFNGVKHIKTIDFKFPALCKLPYYQYIFNNVYFNYGGTPYDILNLFNNFSFSLMPENEPVDVAGIFNNCKNITCSNYQKLGNYLWNNSKVNWTNTSGVFKGCPDDLRANIPVEWGGTLTGWTAPVKLTKEYVDNNIAQLQETINSLTDNDTIYDDTGIVQQISTISSKIQEVNSIIKTDGLGNKFLADDGNYYQILSNESNGLDTDKLSTYLDENGYLQVVPTEFITETQLEQKNYVDESNLFETLNVLNYVTEDKLSGYITEDTLQSTQVIKYLLQKISTLENNLLALSMQVMQLTLETNNKITVVLDKDQIQIQNISPSGQIV